MTINRDTRPWQREENEALAIAAVVGFFIALPAGVVPGLLRPEYGACVGLPVFLLVFIGITWGVYKAQWQKRVTISKVFLVRQHIAHEVIERVLQDKGIPYQKVNGRFQLEGSGLTIQVDKGYAGLSPLWRIVIGIPFLNVEEGSRIQIHPLSAENTAMIMALRQRIDDAFAPRGVA